MIHKPMREYSHEEFVKLVLSLNETQLLELSANCGGYPVLFRMALDERLKHLPFIQTGAAVIMKNSSGEILLQRRFDRDQWGLPGGCQELGENLRDTAVREVYEETGLKLNSEQLELIDVASGQERKNCYPNGDIVYNNTSLYVVEVPDTVLEDVSGNSETKELKFFNLHELPENLMDNDLIEAYLRAS